VHLKKVQGVGIKPQTADPGITVLFIGFRQANSVEGDPLERLSKKKPYGQEQ